MHPCTAVLLQPTLSWTHIRSCVQNWRGHCHRPVAWCRGRHVSESGRCWGAVWGGDCSACQVCESAVQEQSATAKTTSTACGGRSWAPGRCWGRCHEVDDHSDDRWALCMPQSLQLLAAVNTIYQTHPIDHPENCLSLSYVNTKQDSHIPLRLATVCCIAVRCQTLHQACQKH